MIIVIGVHDRRREKQREGKEKEEDCNDGKKDTAASLNVVNEQLVSIHHGCSEKEERTRSGSKMYN